MRNEEGTGGTTVEGRGMEISGTSSPGERRRGVVCKIAK